MKRLRHWLLATFIIVGLVTQSVQGSETDSTNVIPLISMEDIPFSHAVGFMVLQDQINYMVDPGLSKSGNTNLTAPVNIRWEKMTPRAVVERLVKERHLYLIENPQTTITRISEVKTPPMKFEEAFIKGTNEPIPCIRLDNMILSEALAEMRLSGNIRVGLDPKLHDLKTLVSARWYKVTARQALAALCENYNLTVTRLGTNGAFRISQ